MVGVITAFPGYKISFASRIARGIGGIALPYCLYYVRLAFAPRAIWNRSRN